MPISRVTAAQAHRMLRDGTAVLVDVRDPDEYRAGHAPGALHLPLPWSAWTTTSLPSLTAGRDLVLVCRSGNRSQRAAALLAEHGTQAADVIGGLQDWAAQGLPVEDAQGAAGTVL
ncbi:rhodanese-like domain-containing protein [Streptomyces sp. NPDC002143]